MLEDEKRNRSPATSALGEAEHLLQAASVPVAKTPTKASALGLQHVLPGRAAP